MDREFMLLRVAGEQYALPTDRVRQVVVAPAVTPIPAAPPAVLGVFNLRGEIVPLVDLCRLLGLPGDAGPRAPFAVVVDTPDGRAGLTLAEVPRLASLGPHVGRTDTPGRAGIFAVDDEPVVLLDSDALLSPARIGAG